MTPDELLDVFHRRIRLPDADTIPGWKVEHVGPVHRSYVEGPDGAGFVEAPRGLGGDPDAVIAGELAFFRERGLSFEWKTYAYDEPADLGERLARAGFVADDPETLILGEVDRILERPSALPSKAVLREADGPADFHRIAVLMDSLWHNGLERIEERLSAEARMFPERLSVFLVEDALRGPDGPVASAAWIRFHPGTGFASLWGGGTLPAWRRQGLYSALLGHRARLAKERGYEFLRVDASADSRPILQKLGLHAVTTTTPYEWTP
ncbi:GNAT family N-acetyltransferase [Kribbella sandramycini]|uniref:GNAT family N-acetyltransferase n=1 Tax=Kribbella sandramycini TaxID=60450 RepID=A0A7Y4P2S9_9ACTN|nr:GNAT family N-acetyltransferase [Kribbella sandramycini]MBB6570153.1 GNAT superfamily N-acetyltransferase [Kribbella sandramycini]NOL45722.1 GNAT family N-acetyltransferase [Kribbella sandramycini]